MAARLPEPGEHLALVEAEEALLVGADRPTYRGEDADAARKTAYRRP